MTSDTTPPPLVASASSVIPAEDGAYRAFDNDQNYAWAGFGPPQWIQIDFGAGQVFHMFSYTISNEDPFSVGLFPLRVAKDWTIQGSNDATTWDVLDTQVNQTGWYSTSNPTGPRRRTYPCDGLNGYRFFRIYITENQGDPDRTTLTGWIFGAQYNLFY